jgi:ubiquinone/menaquinone biosynthesis C-methylase UbiE
MQSAEPSFSGTADLSDCRCVVCGSKVLLYQRDVADEIAAGAIRCSACGAGFDSIWGVPFLCTYGREDALGLIEITANITSPPRFTPEVLEKWHRILASYHRVEDKDAFLVTVDPALRPYVRNRYAEWREIERLTQGMNFSGCKVLDVGAGSGFDSYWHVLAGANVTALEFSPILAREGRRALSMIRWIGGFSHALPFADGNFDFVFANATLHHMRDVPASITEMLRVLRPGGWLITSADSYRADSQDDATELRLFNTHPDVLLGVNERVPRFAEFARSLEHHRDKITPKISTTIVYGMPQEDGGRLDLAEIREWQFDYDCATLAQTAGNIALKVGLDRPIYAPPRRLPNDGLKPATLAGWLGNQSEALAHLVSWLPEDAINLPFPGRDGSKIELLNGWQLPTDKSWRQAYRRARWYLRRSSVQIGLAFQLWSVGEDAFDILLNGRSAVQVNTMACTWTKVSIALDSVPAGAAFVVEIRKEREIQSFDDGLFRARRRRFKLRSWLSWLRNYAIKVQKVAVRVATLPL